MHACSCHKQNVSSVMRSIIWVLFRYCSCCFRSCWCQQVRLGAGGPAPASQLASSRSSSQPFPQCHHCIYRILFIDANHLLYIVYIREVRTSRTSYISSELLLAGARVHACFIPLAFHFNRSQRKVKVSFLYFFCFLKMIPAKQNNDNCYY